MAVRARAARGDPTSRWCTSRTATRSRPPRWKTSWPSVGVGRLIVAGAQTDACIRSTLHGAFVRGYDATLVGDAHTTEDLSEYGRTAADKVIAHTNLYWSWQDAPGRTADGGRHRRRAIRVLTFQSTRGFTLLG